MRIVLIAWRNDTKDRAQLTSPSLDREVEQRLREHDVRYTAGRRAVVAALSTVDGPRSAAELHPHLRTSVPLSSLYRSLAVLEDAGVIVPHFGSKGLTRYELAEWLTGHHHHLVCIDCGIVEDIEIPKPYETQVQALVEGIGLIVEFTPLSHALEIEGRCVRCA